MNVSDAKPGQILVTGGCGFLGSHLCDALIAGGHNVVVIDDFSTGKWKPIGVDFIVTHDITNPLPDMGSFDRVYNLACPASPIAYQSDPIKTWKTSTIGVLNVLEYIVCRCPTARFLQASTSEIYGDPLEHPQVESYWGNVNPRGERSCYDEGKRAAESLITDYQRCRGFDARIARIFNTYGTRMQPDGGRVVSNFIVQALRGEPLTIFGDGQQTRSFCYVSDLVDGLMRLMESDVTEPVNLGNPVEHTMLELAMRVRELTDWNSDVIMRSLPADDPHRRRPDITRARMRLGWEPVVTLGAGLNQTIAWFKEELGR